MFESIWGVLGSFINNRSLVTRLTVRDVAGRYRGSLLGLVWSFFNPLIMLAVYSFVFGLVFKARWGAQVEENFALILFSGLIFHSLLSECLNRAPTLIVSNVNYVKKVVFPLESLAWVSVLSALFHFALSFLILLFAKILLGGQIGLTWFYLPLVLLPIFIVCLGISWFLSALGVYVRDIAQITGVLSTLLLFLCPIFYPLEVIPEAYQGIIMLNPLSFIVEQARAVLIFSQMPNLQGLMWYSIVAVAFTTFSYWTFKKSQAGFADVL